MIPPLTVLAAEYKWAVLLLALAGSYAWGRADGRALADAESLRAEQIADAALESARRGAAEEIAKLEVKHVTVQRRIERETREVPVYRDCRHPPGVLRALDDALENRPGAAGDRELSAQPRPAG
nr:hypothetical protein [Dechloromonas sp.]